MSDQERKVFFISHSISVGVPVEGFMSQEEMAINELIEQRRIAMEALEKITDFHGSNGSASGMKKVATNAIKAINKR